MHKQEFCAVIKHFHIDGKTPTEVKLETEAYFGDFYEDYFL